MVRVRSRPRLARAIRVLSASPRSIVIPLRSTLVLIGSAIRVTGVGESSQQTSLPVASCQPRCKDAASSASFKVCDVSAISSACGRCAGRSTSWASSSLRTKARACACRGLVQAPVCSPSGSGK
jgi:hypothetical protein